MDSRPYYGDVLPRFPINQSESINSPINHNLRSKTITTQLLLNQMKVCICMKTYNFCLPIYMYLLYIIY